MSDVTIESAIPTLRVTNIDDSLPFYRVLGFEEAWVHQLAPHQPRLAAVRHGTVELFLTEYDVAPAGAVVYLNTRGVDALTRAAGTRDIGPVFGPEDRPWGQREVYFRDPDGNMLRFGEPLSLSS